MTLSNRKCQFLYKKKVGRTLLYEVSPYRDCILFEQLTYFIEEAFLLFEVLISQGFIEFFK